CGRCGNSTTETQTGEACDGTDLSNGVGGPQATCSNFKDSTNMFFDTGAGTLSCFPKSASDACVGPGCSTCVGGPQSCTDPPRLQACHFNLALCQRCGNGDQENTEPCDGTDFGGKNCK